MADPPLPDDVGEGQFLDGATARALRAKAGGAVKRLRRDLLTSVAAVAQQATTCPRILEARRIQQLR